MFFEDDGTVFVPKSDTNPTEGVWAIVRIHEEQLRRALAKPDRPTTELSTDQALSDKPEAVEQGSDIRTRPDVPGTAQHANRRTVFKGDIVEAYKDRVELLTAEGRRSSPAADWEFLRTLQPNIPRRRMRDIRNEHAPMFWRKPR